MPNALATALQRTSSTNFNNHQPASRRPRRRLHGPQQRWRNLEVNLVLHRFLLRTTRRILRRVRQTFTAPPVLDRTWAVDFMSKTLNDDRRVRLIDEGNREGWR